LNYSYNDAGNLLTTNSNHANGVSVNYTYDSLNRLSSVQDNRLPNGANTTSYSYGSVGNLQSYSYPNRVTTSYSYNSLNRLTTLTIGNGVSNLVSYAYTLGASDNRTSVVEGNGRVVNYSYDDLYRLTSETISNSSNATNNGTISYGYEFS
jgi:YD repeat-containing protein